jgi:ferredoxin-NADP reductase
MPLNILRLQAKADQVRLEGVENIHWRLQLPQSLEFAPGQFVMVAFEGVGAKAFSIASSPLKAVGPAPYIDLLAEMTASPYKAKWKEVKDGDGVNIIGPYGAFTLDPTAPKVGFIAGGVGITPFKSMMDHINDERLPTDAVLLYSNKLPEFIAYGRELEEACAANPNLKMVHTITRPQESTVPWDGNKGRIDLAFVEKHVPDFRQRLWYVCAGPTMVAAMCTMLEGAGIEKKRVRREAFTGLH